MTITEIIHQEIDNLPADKSQEVLDFILFLKAKSEKQKWQDLVNAQQSSLNSIWDNTEDEVWNEL